MSIIKTVEEIRRKLNIRLDAEDGEWKTIKGTHVLVDPDGEITKGPERLKSLSKESKGGKSKLTSSAPSMTPGKSLSVSEGKDLLDEIRNDKGKITIDYLVNHPLIQKAKEASNKLMGKMTSSGLRENETANIHTKERGKMRSKIAQIINDRGSVSGVNEKGWTMYKGDVEKGFRAELVIGPPGSGKSSAIVDKVSRGTKARVIDADEIKKKLPEYDGGKGANLVHKESQNILDNKILKEYYSGGSKNGDNIVFPIVGKDDAAVLYHAQMLKDAGYDVHLSYCELSPTESAKRAVSRYIEDGRFMSPAYIGYTVGNKPGEVYERMKKHKGLFASFSHYNNDVPKGEPAKRVEHLNGDGGKEDWEDWR